MYHGISMEAGLQPPCLPLYLRHSVFLFSALVFSRPAGPKAFKNSPVSASRLTIGALGLQMHYHNHLA